MRHLIYAIDQHLEFVNFRRIVITKMLEYVEGVVSKSRVMPYPALITKLLEVNNIKAKDNELVIPIKRHLLDRSLRNMHNAFMRSKLPKGKELIMEVKQDMNNITCTIQHLIEELYQRKRHLALP